MLFRPTRKEIDELPGLSLRQTLQSGLLDFLGLFLVFQISMTKSALSYDVHDALESLHSEHHILQRIFSEKKVADSYLMEKDFL